jgi:hypothetical protein
VGFVVEEQSAGHVGLRECTVEGEERGPDCIGSVRLVGPVGGLIANLADRQAPRSDILPGPLEGVPDSGERATASDECRAVVGDRIRESTLVSVAVAELALEAQPASALTARGEFAEQHRLPGSANTGQRPIGVRRMGLAEVALELSEQRVATRQVRWGDAVSWPERVRELFSSGC